jgi:hypothetical protein
VSDNPLAALRAPFTPGQVGKLPKVNCGACTANKGSCEKHQKKQCRACRAYITTQHIHLDYVGHAHVTERLLEVDPHWTWEPVAFDQAGLPSIDANGGLWMRLTVAGHTRIGYGHAGGKKGGDAVKEAIGDGIRNAAMRFGVALDLWKKETPAPVDDVPTRQVERPQQTPEDRAAELRGQIAVMGKASGKSVDEVAGDFATWSRGTDIRSASVAVLAEYKDHLQNGGPQ